MSILTPLVDQVEDLWPSERSGDEGTARGSGALPDDVLAQLVQASNLLGANRAVSNFGGGNTSAKGTAIDHAGREVAVMWVKGSGSDLATMGPQHFTGLRLDEVLPLERLGEMSDEDMVAYLACCQLDPSMPRCSIETLLHAFVPAAHVHHTHPDGINVLAGTADGERLVHECFGDAAAWIPYIRPGFTLSKQVGEAARSNPALKLVVLAKHGLVVWGDTAEEAYRRTIEVINQAVAFVNERTGDMPRFGGPHPAAHKVTDDARAELLHELLPAVRGAVSSERPKLLTVDTSPRSVEFVSSVESEHLVTVGAPCPDHLVHTKRVPLWIPYDPDTDDADALRARIAEHAEAFRAGYRDYLATYGDDTTVPADPDPRIVLVQHLGLISTGTTTRTSAIARDLYHRAIEVMAGAQALGEFVSLDAEDSFAIEYWPLELYKLAQAPPPGELQGRVALVTGGAGGIGRAIGDALAAAGGCVVAFDLDQAGAEEAVAPYGDNGLAVSGDVTSEESVAAAFAAATDRFGGVDIVVSNAGVASSAALEDTTLAEWNRNHAILVTGYFLVAREAFRVLKRQGRGGAIVFIASKNAIVAGKNAAAYSSAKAAELHLARCLAEEGGASGIRVNTVNPDAVLQGSRIWGSSWREERAAAYGIAPDELEEHYRRRTTLRVNIFPDDIAQAVLHFASPARSGKSTGNLLNVDGGVPAAYAR
jgi:rhamnulose-1-phosphate aldolase/alcohol dehydrogenase